MFNDNSGMIFAYFSINVYCGYPLEGTPNEYPPQMFQWRTGANHSRIIIEYSLKSPLPYHFVIVLLLSSIHTSESAHGKTYNKTCATSEDSDQTAHPRSDQSLH